MLSRVAIALFLALPLTAAPVITSVTPASGPVAGGTTVTIKGSGFSNNCIICSPPFATPEIYFGFTRATDVVFVDSTTLRAVTPPALPSTVDVSVAQLDGSNQAILPASFTFEGLPSDAFDTVLIPIFSPPVNGLFGSQFVTTARLWNASVPPLAPEELAVYGVDLTCQMIDPPPPANIPLTLTSNEVVLPTCTETQGRLLYVTKGASSSLAANLRVHDTSRNALSNGTEIPVVKEKDMSDARIALIGIPLIGSFRSTLRIYSPARGDVLVNVNIGGEGRQVMLTRQDPYDFFEPAYAEIALAPQLSTYSVVIDTPRGPGGTLIPGTPIWAFVTVTNNVTQEITTITPH